MSPRAPLRHPRTPRPPATRLQPSPAEQRCLCPSQVRECFGRCPDNIVLQEPDQLEVDVGETPGEGANGHRVHPRRVRPTFSSADPERSPRSTIRLLALRSGGARLKHLALLAAGCTGKRAGCRLEPAPGTLSPRDRVCTSSCSCSTVEEPSSSTTGGGQHTAAQQKTPGVQAGGIHAKDPGVQAGAKTEDPRGASRGQCDAAGSHRIPRKSISKAEPRPKTAHVRGMA